MYFPTDPEENQDETTPAPSGLQKVNSPFAGFGAQPLPYPRLSLNGIPPADKAMESNQVAGTATRPPETMPNLSFAQRLAALGNYPFSGASNDQTAEGAPKLGVGHRIMRNIGQQPGASAATRPTPLPNAIPEMWRRRLERLPDLNPSQSVRLEPLSAKSSITGLNNGQHYGEFFSDFVPAGADVNNSRFIAGSQTAWRNSRDPLEVAGLGIPSQMKVPSRVPSFSRISNAGANLGVNPRQQNQPLSITQSALQQGSPGNQQNPLGANADPEISAHLLPDNAGAELRELVKPQRWNKVSGVDKTRLATLMSQDMSAANAFAQALLNGKPAPAATGNFTGSQYFPPDVDNLIHSSAWIDGRLKPEERSALARLVQRNDVAGATALAKKLQRAFWYEGRYPQFPKTVAGRVNRAAEIAESYQYNKRWLVEAEKRSFRQNSDKCNLFVSDVLAEAWLEPPMRRHGWGGPVNAAVWADRSQNKVGHWQIVNGPPQPGDVVSEITGHDPKTGQPWAHVGIVAGNGRTASASTLVYPKGMIVVNNWGFRKEDLDKRVIRRYVP